MLDFTTQKKLLDPLLKNPQNQNCADCSAVAPTWVSLDFGVFLCSNCSGAHRGLGPTITRVRSANLDKWQQQWLDNMKIGNTSLNEYWEGDSHVFEKKPKPSATLHEIGRFVFEKYIKKKWVVDKDQADPLKRYKNGQYEISKPNKQKQPQPKPEPAPRTVQPIVQQQKAPQAPKAEVSLLDFDFPPTTTNNSSAPVQQTQPVQSQQPTAPVHEEDEFSDFTQAGTTVPEGNKADSNLISFDALLTQQQQPQAPQPQQPVHHAPPGSYQALKAQNMQMHHPYNPQIGQHNMVYQAQYQQQPHLAHQHSYPAMQGYQMPMGYHQGGPVSMMQQGRMW